MPQLDVSPRQQAWYFSVAVLDVRSCRDGVETSEVLLKGRDNDEQSISHNRGGAGLVHPASLQRACSLEGEHHVTGRSKGSSFDSSTVMFRLLVLIELASAE